MPLGETEVTFMPDYKQNMAGLNSAEAKKLQDRYGKNELTPQYHADFCYRYYQH